MSNRSWDSLGSAVQLNGAGASAYFEAAEGSPTCQQTRTYRSNVLRLSNAGLQVPSTAKVIGVVAEITMRSLGRRPELRTVHLWGPRSSGPAQSSSVWSGGAPGMLTNDFRALTFGGARNNWSLGGDVLTPNFVNNDGFSVNLAFNQTLECNDADSNPQVDAARVQVYYEDCQ